MCLIPARTRGPWPTRRSRTRHALPRLRCQTLADPGDGQHPVMPRSGTSVRGHEKVPCGQIQVPAGGQLKVPIPRSPCLPGVWAPGGDGGGATQSPHRPGAHVPPNDGVHIHAAFLALRLAATSPELAGSLEALLHAVRALFQITASAASGGGLPSAVASPAGQRRGTQSGPRARVTGGQGAYFSTRAPTFGSADSTCLAAPPRTAPYALMTVGRPEAAARASVTDSRACDTSPPRLAR
jgi:hypothetical protein